MNLETKTFMFGRNGSMTIEILAAALGLYAALRKDRKVSGVGYAAAREPYWYGIKNIQFISHGEWADPELYYRGKLYNAVEVEDDLYYQYQHSESSLSFEDWIRANESDIKYSLMYEYTPVSGYVGDPYPRYTGNGNQWRNMDCRSKYLELLRRGFTEAEAARMAQAIY